MNSEYLRPRRLARILRRVLLASLSSTLLIWAGCVDGSTSPDEPYQAYLSFGTVLSSGVSRQVGTIDGWRVQVLRSGESVIGEAGGGVAPRQETIEVPLIQISLNAACEGLVVRIELLSGGTVWWVAEQPLQVCAGEDNDVGVSEVEFDWTGPPQPGMSTASLVFSVPQGEDSSQTFDIMYNAGGAVNWDIRVEEGSLDWLTIGPTSGTVTLDSPQTVTVGVNATGLEVGQYFANLVVGGFPGPTQVVFVELTVMEGPRLGLAPTELRFETDKGTNPPAQSFEVFNEGGGTLNWNASEEVGWLTLESASGSLEGGGSQTVTVVVGVDGLEAGEHEAGITVTASAVSGSPRDIPVLLVVAEVFGSAVTGTVRVDGSGLSGVTVTLDGTASRVATTGADGRYEFNELRDGSYTVTIGGYPSGVEFASTEKNVTLGVGESEEVNFSGTLAAELWVSTDALEFTVPGEGSPDPEFFQIKNVGGGTLDWGYFLWDTGLGCIKDLFLSPSGGSLEAGESVTVRVDVVVSGCSLGWNLGGRGFTITGSDGSSVPFDLTVLVVPSPAPLIDYDRHRRVCQNCCISDPDGDWYKETADYIDLEGDVDKSTSTLYATWSFSDGTSGTYTYPPGSGFITYTGDGSTGTVTTDPCYNFLDGARKWVDVTMRLRDGGGNDSNVVSFRITPG